MKYSMLKFACATVLAALQLSSVVASPAPDSAAPSVELERRDKFSFYATQNWLQFQANLFADETFSNSDGEIANHIKNCSDAFDSATIELASLIPPGQLHPVLAPADGPSLNTTFVPSTQHAILSTLNTLLFSKAFFGAVNGNPQMRIVFCHWTGDLAYQNNIFLGFLAASAPSADFAASWTQQQNVAAAGYAEFLGNVNGFRCNGL